MDNAEVAKGLAVAACVFRADLRDAAKADYYRTWGIFKSHSG